jgi:hypothetical protein
MADSSLMQGRHHDAQNESIIGLPLLSKVAVDTVFPSRVLTVAVGSVFDCCALTLMLRAKKRIPREDRTFILFGLDVDELLFQNKYCC